MCQGRVRFGRDDVWTAAKRIHGNITCDTDHFGDPLPFVAKECQCQQATGKMRQRIGRVNLFIMGSFGVEVPVDPGNYWTSLDEFPKYDPREMYLGPSAALESSPLDEPGSASYRYDPHNPAPM